MNVVRTTLLGILFACLSVGSALAKGERLRFATQTHGGEAGKPRVVERSWYRPDGAKVSEQLHYGVKGKQFKNVQGGSWVNTGLESLRRTTEGAHHTTIVERKLVGNDKGTTTTKRWKNSRYDFELQRVSNAKGVSRRVYILDRVTYSSVTINEKGPDDLEIRPSTARDSGDESVKQVELMTDKARSILATRKR